MARVPEEQGRKGLIPEEGAGSGHRAAPAFWRGSFSPHPEPSPRGHYPPALSFLFASKEFGAFTAKTLGLFILRFDIQAVA